MGQWYGEMQMQDSLRMIVVGQRNHEMQMNDSEKQLFWFFNSSNTNVEDKFKMQVSTV